MRSKSLLFDGGCLAAADDGLAVTCVEANGGMVVDQYVLRPFRLTPGKGRALVEARSEVPVEYDQSEWDAQSEEGTSQRLRYEAAVKAARLSADSLVVLPVGAVVASPDGSAKVTVKLSRRGAVFSAQTVGTTGRPSAVSVSDPEFTIYRLEKAYWLPASHTFALLVRLDNKYPAAGADSEGFEPYRIAAVFIRPPDAAPTTPAPP